MEDSVQIKKFEFSDIPQFGDLCDDSEWYSPQVKATTGTLLRYKEYRDNCFVAYEGTELVGFIYGGVLCDTLYPQFMFVKEKKRKAGIGKRLMSALEESSHCSVSLIFYHKTLESHYQNEGYEVGTELRVAIKELVLCQDLAQVKMRNLSSS